MSHPSHRVGMGVGFKTSREPRCGRQAASDKERRRRRSRRSATSRRSDAGAGPVPPQPAGLGRSASLRVPPPVACREAAASALNRGVAFGDVTGGGIVVGVSGVLIRLPPRALRGLLLAPARPCDHYVRCSKRVRWRRGALHARLERAEGLQLRRGQAGCRLAA